MSETVTKSDAISGPAAALGDPSTRSAQVVKPANARSREKFVLSSQYRVTDGDVFVLTPEHAVSTSVTDAGALDQKPSPGTGETQEAVRTSDVKDLTAKIAALELAIAKTVDQWEPDGTGRDAYAGKPPPAMAWKDNVELDATGRPLGDVTALRSGSGGVQHPDRDGTTLLQSVDENMLREIVADIVRSELQGALGERITRNVRKLVRREIHSALAARSLD